MIAAFKRLRNGCKKVPRITNHEMNSNIMKPLFLIIAFLTVSSCLRAQDFLDSLMMEENSQQVIATFKGTRLIGLPTIETQGKGTIEFRVAHRFGDFGSGGYNFWGLDGGATIWLGLDYAIDDRLTVGLGRSSLQKMYDGHIKYRWLQQTSDNRMPITLTLLATANYIGLRDPNRGTPQEKYTDAGSRMSYMHSILIARKFGERLSIQLSPTHIHYNIVDRADDLNTIFALGFAGRYKLSRRLAVSAEYSTCVNNYASVSGDFADVISGGLELETGGHVFQVYVSNATALNPVQFIPYTTSRWDGGGGRLGFSISRVF
jgi:hypothetical protein